MQSYSTIISEFIDSPEFWSYHGSVLASAWIFGCTLAILAKRFNIYLHALGFFIVDVTSLIFMIGAWIRVYPSLQLFLSWPLLKQMHVLGGSMVGTLIILQHSIGVVTLLSESKENRNHVVLGFIVVNLARVVVMFGFLLAEKHHLLLYSAVAFVVLFVGGVYRVYFEKSQQKRKAKQKAENKKTKIS